MKTKLLFAFIILFTVLNAQYTKLYDMTGNNGLNPYGSLYMDGTYLYGMTYNAGSGGSGTLLKIKQDGTSNLNILDFGGAIGARPRGSVISDGTYLYGMTTQGGSTSNMGSIFKVKPDGTFSSGIFSFSSANGNFPTGTLVSDGTYLYGIADQGGGANSFGVIFKIKPDGTSYTKLYSFTVTANGKSPNGTLLYDGTYLYGNTASGGTNDMGTLFKIKTDGTGFTKLFDFNGTANGNNPNSVISDGSYLYGMTTSGGAIDSGVVFKIMKDGTNFTKLHDFTGKTSGSRPLGDLVLDGNMLYGMTSAGGDKDLGIMFKIQTNGTGFTKMLNFDGASNGSHPSGSFTINGTDLYGMTSDGGSNNGGVVFKINVNTIATGVAESKINSTINVFPNPSSTELSFEIPLQENIKVCLFDASGREVINISNYKSMSPIDISGLATGVYNYQIVGVNNIYTGKWVKN